MKISLLLNGALQAETSTRAVVSSCTPDIGDAYVPPVADAYERWLMLLYRDVLGRAPERGAVDAARRALISGATRTSVALPVLRSPEAADRATARMFSTLLGRPANPGESSSLIDVLESQEYADLSQPEFYGPDSGSLVQAAACDLLGRKAADSEVRAARMFLTRDQAVPAFLGSDDYRRGFVNQIYTRFLRRAATESELSQGATAQPDDVAAAVAGSAEYFRRANGGGTIDQLQTLTRGRIRVALRRAAELRVGVLRGGRRIGTVRLGHMARGVSVAKWRRRGGAPASLIVEAWSRGRLIDATDPIAAGR
ncbi:MAG TPA: hypothetical protein VF066_08385 [Thermoleophilaceae bacterium]